MSEHKLDRRQLLKGALLGAAAVTVLPELAAADAPVKLPETDPMAQALGYHIDAKKVDTKKFPSYKPTQTCLNCMQLQAGAGAERGCNIFAGKLVNVGGWCSAWVQKP